MSNEQIEQLAQQAYPMPEKPWGMDWQDYEAQQERRTLAEREAYMAGMAKLAELVDAFNDGQHAIIYIWDTNEYSSQRMVKNILLELS